MNPAASASEEGRLGDAADLLADAVLNTLTVISSAQHRGAIEQAIGDDMVDDMAKALGTINRAVHLSLTDRLPAAWQELNQARQAVGDVMLHLGPQLAASTPAIADQLNAIVRHLSTPGPHGPTEAPRP